MHTAMACGYRKTRTPSSGTNNGISDEHDQSTPSLHRSSRSRSFTTTRPSRPSVAAGRSEVRTHGDATYLMAIYSTMVRVPSIGRKGLVKALFASSASCNSMPTCISFSEHIPKRTGRAKLLIRSIPSRSCREPCKERQRSTASVVA